MNVRRKWKSVKWLAAVACGVVMASAAQAAVVYDYVAGNTNYVANKGDVINVPIYLRETLTNGSTSVINADGGLYGASVALTRMTSGLPADPSGFVGTAASVLLNKVNFDGNSAVAGVNGQGSPSATDVSLTEAIGNSSPGVQTGNTGGGAVPGVANQVYLGTVQITVGSGTTTFALKEYNTGGGNTITNNNFYDLDVDNASPAFTGVGTRTTTFTVSVPEPTSLGFVMGGGMLALARRRRATVA
jgi:hypothetical protein